ncbi:MAG: hypothetical protein ACXWWO_05955 [Candidatus Limnocylindria bacterium]
MSTSDVQASGDPLLRVVENLSRYHREHEKHYSEAPLETALRLLRYSSTLKTLAEHWAVADPEPAAPSPYAGAEDLNDERAIEQTGVLFMEGEGQPTEITALKRDLAIVAEDHEQGGIWLAQAMENSWSIAESLTAYPGLADLLGERHRIILDNWQSAQLIEHSARLLRRALRLLDEVEFTPAALRVDLAGARIAPRYMLSAAELIDLAAELTSRWATLERGNERRWRVFHDRVAGLLGPSDAA